MRRLRPVALWWALLLVVVAQTENQRNSTHLDQDGTIRYEPRVNFTDSWSHRENSTWDDEVEFHSDYTKNSSGEDNRDEPSNLRGENSTKVEGDFVTSHDLRPGNSSVEDKTLCNDTVCIQICCELGYRMINDVCTPDDGDYFFPEVDGAGKSVDDMFSLVVMDPCKDGRYLLNPSLYPNDEYVILPNGSIYQPQLEVFLYPMMYCFAVVQGSKFEIAICFEEESQLVSGEKDFNSIPFGIIGSLPFLLATFVVYTVLPELWNMHGYTLRGYVGSLFVAYLVLAPMQLILPDYIPDEVCIASAFVIHFSFLASFFWLNVMCFDIWWTFGGFRSLQGSVKQRERKKFIMYSIYAWGCASALTIVCAIMDFVPTVPKNFIRPEFGSVRCWYTSDKARAVYFYGPMSVTVICNIGLFISTALKIVRHKKDTAHHLKGSESRRHDDNKQWFNLYLKLFIVMGINWSMEIISWIFKESAPKYVWYISDLTNALQGLIIFIIFVWKDKIKRLLVRRFGCQERGIFSRNSTRSGFHSTVSRTCTTTSGVTTLSLQEKISPYVQTNCRAKNSSDETDCP